MEVVRFPFKNITVAAKQRVPCSEPRLRDRKTSEEVAAVIQMAIG